MSFALALRHDCDMCYVIRGCTISRDVSRTATDIIYRGTYRAPRWILYIKGRIARRDGCMNRYVPHGSRTVVVVEVRLGWLLARTFVIFSLLLVRGFSWRHDLEYDSLRMSTCVSTSMGESIVVDRMYRSSYVLLKGQDPWADLVISVMIDLVLFGIVKVYHWFYMHDLAYENL
uniref:Uncharacterized protein n=1 Tax=Solanum tuberosum TaxID=4113 RepID=M1DI84_SOLTU